MVAGGVEQEVDYSWSLPRDLRPGTRHSIAFEFLDPRLGTRLACHVLTVACGGAAGDPVETSEGICTPDARAPADRNGGRPSLVGLVPAFRMYDSALGGAEMDVEFVIRGQVDEAWYCPRLDVYWPDGTRTIRESDCPPFASDDARNAGPVRWKFTRVFPAGEWPVKACVSKGGKVLACETVTVRVLGGGER
jgi:hypothetical protein